MAADINFSVATTVTIGATNYTISAASEATSMTVGASSLTVTVPASSTFTLVSSDKFLLNNDQVVSQQCTASQNSLALTGSITVVVTPDITAVCTVSSSGGTSSGGGGGGPITDTTPPTSTSIVINSAAVTTSTTAVTLTLSAVGASDVMISNDSAFTGGTWLAYSTSKNWTLTTGDGVKTVYAKFRDDAMNVSTAVSDTITLTTGVAAIPATPATPATPVAPVVPVVLKALPYPVAKTTAEMQANLAVLLQNLAALQASQKAATPATPATPSVGSSIPSAGSYKVSIVPGSKGSDVTALQNFLKLQGKDIYPEGLVTGYYGSLTTQAVQKFQEKYGIAAPGVTGYGNVGPKTRAKINSLLGL